MSPNIYLSQVTVKDHPYIAAVNIDLSANKRTLIITGKNGSGKTTLLNLLAEHLHEFRGGALIGINQDSIAKGSLVTTYNSLDPRDPTPKIITASFKAKRTAKLAKVDNIQAPQANKLDIQQSASEQFLQYLVNRKSQQAFAITDGKADEANDIKQWFEQLNRYFSDIFEKTVTFEFDRNQLSFTLVDEQHQVIDLNLLSDGYSAIIHIFTDLIMRMEANKFGDYSQNGIVLIDEVETHLHVSLQKQILPLLKTFFPNIQFIVTTHSPFVLSSVEDALIFDMEKNELIDQQAQLWQFSYEALVEGYFETEKFSLVLKTKIQRFKALTAQSHLSREEKKELRQLEKTLSNVPSYKNPAIEHELKNLGLK